MKKEWQNIWDGWHIKLRRNFPLTIGFGKCFQLEPTTITIRMKEFSRWWVLFTVSKCHSTCVVYVAFWFWQHQPIQLTSISTMNDTNWISCSILHIIFSRKKIQKQKFLLKSVYMMSSVWILWCIHYIMCLLHYKHFTGTIEFLRLCVLTSSRCEILSKTRHSWFRFFILYLWCSDEVK